MANVTGILDIQKTSSEKNGDMLVVRYEVEGGGREFVAVTPTPAAARAVEMFVSGEIGAAELVDSVRPDLGAGAVAARVARRLERVTDRISTDGVNVWLDNDDMSRTDLDPALERHLVRLLAEGAGQGDWRAWAAFADRLYRNVDPEIRGRIVGWLEAQGWLSFTEDGRIVGYRGCMTGRDGVACSVHCGPAVVDGEPVNGHVPNPDGAVVEMPRSRVTRDFSEGCASGLHVGTYDYAASWASGNPGPKVLRVAVAPEDVVSVPFDCSSQKIRCCRFEVLDHVDLPGLARSEWEGMSYGCSGPEWDGPGRYLLRRWDADADDWYEEEFDCDGEEDFDYAMSTFCHEGDCGAGDVEAELVEEFDGPADGDGGDGDGGDGSRDWSRDGSRDWYAGWPEFE